MRYELFARRQCPSCPAVKEYCAAHFGGEVVDCDTAAGLDFARARGVQSTPTAIFYDGGGAEIGRFHSVPEIRAAFGGG